MRVNVAVRRRSESGSLTAEREDYIPDAQIDVPLAWSDLQANRATRAVYLTM
jgi:hypothetical protein